MIDDGLSQFEVWLPPCGWVALCPYLAAAAFWSGAIVRLI